MRLLVLAVLALAAVAVGAACVPHGGCDCDFGAGNGTAYLVVDNPYNLTLPLDVTYGIGEGRHGNLLLNVSGARVVTFCGLGDGWLYIQQHTSPLGSPLMFYPLAVPRYVVLRAGESATITVTTLFAPATTIAVAVFLLVAIALRPKLGRWTVYAVPEPLRATAIRSAILSSRINIIFVISIIEILLLLDLFLPVSPLSNILGLIRGVLLSLVGYVTDVSDNLILELIALIALYVVWSLGGFYLTFHRRQWIYIYLLISFIISIILFVKLSRSLLFFLVIILSITSLLSSSVILIVFYNIFMSFLLLVYGVAIFIYYDMNFGRTVAWNLPLQIPAISPEVWIIAFPLLAVFIAYALLFVIVGTEILVRPRSVYIATSYPALWPPLWWWFGLGIFALDELTVRSLLHKLSASGGIIVDLSRSEKALVVSADLYGMYLCKLGDGEETCDDVEWVRYGEVKFKVSRIIEGAGDRYVVGSFVRKVVLPILVGVLAFFTTKYTGLPIILTFPLFLIIFLPVYYKYDDLRELREYVQAIKQDIKVCRKHWLSHIIKVCRKYCLSHIIWAFTSYLIFLLLTTDLAVLGDAVSTAITISFLLATDLKLSSYLFPELELRLMSVDSLVIGLARGGCLQWAKAGGAPRGRAFVIRDGDCLVVVSPYVENVRNGLRRYLCGPACPVVRVVGGGRVAVGVVDLQRRRYAYYVVDSSR